MPITFKIVKFAEAGKLAKVSYFINGDEVSKYAVSRALTNTRTEGESGIFERERDVFRGYGGASVEVSFEPFDFDDASPFEIMDTLKNRAKKVRLVFEQTYPAVSQAWEETFDI